MTRILLLTGRINEAMECVQIALPMFPGEIVLQNYHRRLADGGTRDTLMRILPAPAETFPMHPDLARAAGALSVELVPLRFPEDFETVPSQVFWAPESGDATFVAKEEQARPPLEDFLTGRVGAGRVGSMPDSIRRMTA